MPYVTSIERLAKAEGKAEALLQILEQRFATQIPADLAAAVRTTSDLRQLARWVNLALQANSLEEFRRLAQL